MTNKKIQLESLVIGDMLKIANMLDAEQFNLVYLDPPFLTGINRIGTDKKYFYKDHWQNDHRIFIDWLRLRIKAIYRLLKINGSLVLHLDWRATHYAKVMLDEIFGRDGFINEIIWHYTGGGRSKSRFSCKHDTLLWYCKGSKPQFNIDEVRIPYNPNSGYAKGGIKSASGRKYMPDPRGTPVDDVWDIPIINPMSSERVGYPTQKPKKLLTRIIKALSNPGDLIGDFCCGSGTTLVCAHLLDRRFIGADQSKPAIECSKTRLQNEAGFEAPVIEL